MTNILRVFESVTYIFYPESAVKPNLQAAKKVTKEDVEVVTKQLAVSDRYVFTHATFQLIRVQFLTKKGNSFSDRF